MKSEVTGFLVWVSLVMIVGAILGLMLMTPGGHEGTGAYEFGRTVLGPLIFGATVGLVLGASTGSIGVLCAAVVRRMRRSARQETVHHIP